MNSPGLAEKGMEHRAQAGMQPKVLAWRGWVPLVIGGLLLLVANGRNTIPAAAWVAPVLLLRFTRWGRTGIRLPSILVVLFATWLFQFRGMVPAPTAVVYMVAAFYAVLGLLPYAVDRFFGARLRPGWRTLLFPAAWAAIEYLTSVLCPYGSWGSAAYSQYGQLPFVQLVSVTGLFGITFLLGWFATTVNLAWESGWSWREAQTPVTAFVTVMLVVLIGGGLRLAFFAPGAPLVRIASLSRGNFPSAPTPELESRLFGNSKLTAEETEQIRNASSRGTNDLLARSERAADANAKVIFWAEATGHVFKEDEPSLIARAQELAKRKQIYLGLGLAVWKAGDAKPLENKLVLIAPDGQIAYEFWKARPVPGGEAAMSKLGDGNLKSTTTPYGRVGSAICFDMDFPQLLAEAGKMNTDILIVPSNDWEAIDPWHTQMATFRAVEQGFNLVRQVRSGMSMAVDYEGRVLAQMDDFHSPDREMTSYVPTRGVRTVYSRIGDVFSWLCIAGVFVIPFAGRPR